MGEGRRERNKDGKEEFRGVKWTGRVGRGGRDGDGEDGDGGEDVESGVRNAGGVRVNGGEGEGWKVQRFVAGRQVDKQGRYGVREVLLGRASTTAAKNGEVGTWGDSGRRIPGNLTQTGQPDSKSGLRAKPKGKGRGKGRG